MGNAAALHMIALWSVVAAAWARGYAYTSAKYAKALGAADQPADDPVLWRLTARFATWGVVWGLSVAITSELYALSVMKGHVGYLIWHNVPAILALPMVYYGLASLVVWRHARKHRKADAKEG